MDKVTSGAERSAISRRTVVAGAAWALPVVAIAPAAQAVTCSRNVCVAYTGTACKVPGNSGGPGEKKAYKYNFTITNMTGECVTVLFYSFTVNGAPAPDYISITPRAGSSTGTSTCNSCSCATDWEDWDRSNQGSLPGHVWPTKGSKTPPDDYFSYDPPGPTAVQPAVTCVGSGTGNYLDVWVVGGEYPSSAEGNDTVIRWIVLDAACNIIQTNSVNPTNTPPNCA